MEYQINHNKGSNRGYKSICTPRYKSAGGINILQHRLYFSVHANFKLLELQNIYFLLIIFLQNSKMPYCWPSLHSTWPPSCPVIGPYVHYTFARPEDVYQSLALLSPVVGIPTKYLFL